MRPAVWIAVLFCGAVAAAADKRPKEGADLQQKFDVEFLGKQFVSKVPLSGYLKWQLDNGTTAHRLVDTEYNLDGSMDYLVRTGTVESPGFFPVSNHIQLGQVTRVYPAGTTFWVIKNEIRKDRIELWLTANSAGQQTVENYAKLKLMLKDGYQRTEDYDALALRISNIFRIERVEKINELLAELKSLDGQIDAAEARFKEMNSPVSQYQAAQQLQTVLQQILHDQVLYQQAGGKAAIHGAKYRQRLDEIQQALPSLQAKSRDIRVQALRQQLDDNGKQLTSLRETLDRPVTSSSDLERYKSALTHYSEAVANRDGLVRKMQQENIPVSESEIRVTQEAKLKVPVFQSRISTESAHIVLLDVDRQYKALARRHDELLDKLLQSLGTANEKGNREKLISNLEEMRQNRIKAQELGSKTASVELNKLQNELTRMQR